ncbi:Protein INAPERTURATE POLLEN1, partial [Mucuna pruriens]
MLKAVAPLFSRHKQSRPFKEYYGEWFSTLKNNLLPLLRRSIAGESPTILSTHVEMVHQHFQSYYHALDAVATSDPFQLVSQEWRNSLERPLLWLGDLHPFLFTNLARSFLHEDSPPDTDTDTDTDDDNQHPFSDRPWQVALAWRNPSDSLTARMDQIECGLRVIVPTLSDRLKRAEDAFVDRVVRDWFRCRHRKGGAKVTLGADVKGHMEELVSVFLYGNRLRRSVLVDIISVSSVYQAALFLEGLAQFLIGFRDHDLLNAFASFGDNFVTILSDAHKTEGINLSGGARGPGLCLGDEITWSSTINKCPAQNETKTDAIDVKSVVNPRRSFLGKSIAKSFSWNRDVSIERNKTRAVTEEQSATSDVIAKMLKAAVEVLNATVATSAATTEHDSEEIDY